MTNADEYGTKYNDLHRRLIAASHDPSISAETIRQWEQEALDLTDRAFESFGAQLSRYPEVTQLERRTNIQFSATNALRVRRTMPREEYSRRFRELKENYTRLREVLPSITSEGMYYDELKFIEREQRALSRTAFNPVGCLIMVAILVVVIVLVAR